MARTKDAESRGKGSYNPPSTQRARVNYNRRFLKDRKIAEGRRIAFAKMPDLMKDFGTLKWESFLTLEGPIYPELVREFYSNFTFENGQVSFILFEKSFSYSLEDFGKILDVPTKGHQFYSRQHDIVNFPSFVADVDLVLSQLCKTEAPIDEIYDKGVLGRHLLPRYDMWSKVISFNIYCKWGNHSNIHATQLALIWCLENKQPVDIAFLMASRMSNLLTETTRALPYGMHLNKVFQHLGFTHEVVVKPSLEPMERKIEKSASRKRRATDEGSSKGKEILESEEEEEAMDSIQNLDTNGKLDQIYRNQIKNHQTQSKMKKLLKGVLRSLSCKSGDSVKTRGGSSGANEGD